MFTVERHGPWEVLLLEGELDLAVGPDLQSDVIHLLPPDEAHALAVDLSEVTFIDSTVIGILAMAHKRARRWGGRVVLVGASGRVERLLRLTGLATVVDVCRSLDDLDATVGPPLGDEAPSLELS